MGGDPRLVAPPGRRPSTGLILGLACGGAVILVLVAVLVIRLTRDPKYVMTTPPTAGGLVLTGQGAGNLGDPQKDVSGLGIKVDTVVSATYKDPASSASPPAEVGFVGITGDVGDPGTFLHSSPLAKNPAATVMDTDAGGAGKAMCATISGAATLLICMWATKHSFGMISPTNSMTPAQAADLMRRMRRDLEHSQ